MQRHGFGSLLRRFQPVFHHAVFELEVQAAGVLPGGMLVNLVTLGEQDVPAFSREHPRGGAT